ncbi:MAG TPA: IclR family transcriptional regulator [Jatrophihabitans sp.]|jgi:DNA-binding IclR family transcriptional regulator
MSGDRVARLFDVLELLATHRTGMSVTEVSKRLNLPLSSAHNLLQRLVAADVVVASEGPRYSVGTRLVRLGIRTVDGLEVGTVARKHLAELARAVNSDVYLAVRLGTRVVYVERFPSGGSVAVEIRLGQELFLHATAVGKLFSAFHPRLEKKMLDGPRPKLTEYTLTTRDALRAELATIRERGWAASREEAIPGIVGIALPILDSNDQLTAAVHVSALRAHMDDAQLEAAVELARASADAVERDLGR